MRLDRRSPLIAGIGESVRMLFSSVFTQPRARALRRVAYLPPVRVAATPPGGGSWSVPAARRAESRGRIDSEGVRAKQNNSVAVVFVARRQRMRGRCACTVPRRPRPPLTVDRRRAGGGRRLGDGSRGARFRTHPPAGRSGHPWSSGGAVSRTWSRAAGPRLSRLFGFEAQMKSPRAQRGGFGGRGVVARPIRAGQNAKPVTS